MFQRTLLAMLELGLPALGQLALYRIGLRSGYLSWRLPVYSWSQVELSRILNGRDLAEILAQRTWTSTFNLQVPQDSIAREVSAAIFNRALAIAQGRFQLFGIEDVMLGSPPDWHAFAPLAGVTEPLSIEAGQHWSRYDLEALACDVKLLWEASRFGWVYPLAQAYALSGDETHFEVFWTLFDSWLEANQPQAGLHWFSAQEVAIRLIALLFAAHTFKECLNTSMARWSDMLKGIAIHAMRIPPTLSYARAQQNNHLLLESAALYLTGLAFPEFKQAGKWRRLGMRLFEDAVREQVFNDGGYVQHSTNYQRLALQAGVLVAHSAQESGEPLSEATLEAMGRMAICLASLVETEGGGAPNFGPNDGAELLQLSARPFTDFRPTTQAAGKQFLGYAFYPVGEWDDLSQWLGIEGRKDEHPRQLDIQRDDLPDAGLYVTRNGPVKTIFRAASFKNRPGHSDQLHLDIWHGDINLARDPGTYLYNADPPWDNSLSGAWCHNTVMLDGDEPMLKGGRFLWLNRSQAIVRRWGEGSLQVLFGWVHAQQWPGLLYQRSIAMLGSSMIIVVDEILDQGDHQLVLNWNLADLDWGIEGSSITLKHEKGSALLAWPGEGASWGLYRAGACAAGEEIVKDPQTYGWHAATYARKLPALQLVIQARQTLPVRLVSTWSFDGAGMSEAAIKWGLIKREVVAFEGIRWGSEEWVI